MPDRAGGWFWRCAAWAVALVATPGALFIGEVRGQASCVWCWYQRILMFPLVPILGIAAFRADRLGAVCALPFALGGIGFAAGAHAIAGDRAAERAGDDRGVLRPCLRGLPRLPPLREAAAGAAPERREAGGPPRGPEPLAARVAQEVALARRRGFRPVL